VRTTVIPPRQPAPHHTGRHRCRPQDPVSGRKIRA